MTSKEASEFKRWHEDKSKKRVCDKCFHQHEHNKHYQKVVSEREAKKKASNPTLKNYHLSEEANRTREVRNRIAEIQERRALKELFEI